MNLESIGTDSTGELVPKIYTNRAENWSRNNLRIGSPKRRSVSIIFSLKLSDSHVRRFETTIGVESAGITRKPYHVHRDHKSS